MKTLTDTSFNEVVTSPKPVIIKFEAKWCQPCKAMTPIMLEIEKELADQVTFFSANVEHCSLIAQRFKVTQIPALLAIDNGVVTAQKTGAAKKSEVLAWIDLALPSLRQS
ncbi:thioredoxin 1 [Bradyrhizobium sp. AZCC 1610]|uniref:thioredoxin family protein n=1 Tax=Bradyrhizobium sp. AZCC 1610 TaxID=3117020 RepID=UPI002FEF63CD